MLKKFNEILFHAWYSNIFLNLNKASNHKFIFELTLLTHVTFLKQM